MKLAQITLSLLSLASVAIAAGELRIGVTKAIPAEKCHRKAKAGDQIAVHYTGKLADGTVFDTSSKRGEPIQFQLGAGLVIKGWDQGLTRMCIGERRKLTIPPHLAYGSQGAGGVIPGDATLTFEVELVAIMGHEPPVSDDTDDEIPTAEASSDETSADEAATDDSDDERDEL